MPKSCFVLSTDQFNVGDYVEVSVICRAFEEYLIDRDYEPAVEVCPWAEGEYVGAEDAYDLVDDFLGEYPEHEGARDELLAHAVEIGQVSNAFSDGPEPDYDDEPEPDYDNEPDPENA